MIYDITKEELYPIRDAASYKCIVPEGAAPCVADSRFDPDIAGGTVKGKVFRRIKQGVKMGQKVGWVGVESRDQFEPVNDQAIKLNELDYNYLLGELESMGIDVPDDATLGELGKTFNRNDPRLAHCFAAYGIKKTKTRTFGPKAGGVPKVSKPADTEADDLRAKITALGGKYHNKAGVPKLKETLTTVLKDWLIKHDADAFDDDTTLEELLELQEEVSAQE